MMATGRLFGDGRNRGHRRADTKGPGGLVIGAVALLSASLVVAGGFAYADAPVPTPIETSSVITDAPSSPVPITSETQAPTALPSATPSEPAVQPSTPSVPVVQPSVDTSKDPVAKFPTTLAEDADAGVAPLRLGPEDGVNRPYVHWTVKNGSTLVGGATFNLQARIGGGWGASQQVEDCVAQGCAGLDKDPDEGEFQVSGLNGDRRYRIRWSDAPAGYLTDGRTGWQEMDSNIGSNGTENFGNFSVKMVPSLQPVCAAGYIYSVSGDGQLYQIDPSGTVEAVGTSASGVSNFNGLGIGSGGTPVYALMRSSRSGTSQNGTVYTYGTSNGVWTSTGHSTSALGGHTGTNLVGGAVNLHNGLYYFGGFTAGGNFKVYEYNPSASPRISLKGTVITTATESANGDMAFDAIGNLYIVRGSGSTTTVFSVTANDFNAASGGSLNSSVTKGFTTMSDVNGVAFDASGRGFLGSSSTLRSYAMPDWSDRRDDSTALNSTDLASCSSPPTITIEKFIEGGRVSATDQFGLVLKQGNTTIGEATTTGTAIGLQDRRVGPVPTVRGVELTFSETASGTTSLNNYMSSYRCLVDGVQTVGSDGTSGKITIPAGGQSVECRFYNSPLVANVTVNKLVADANGQNPMPASGWTVGATATATSGTVTKNPAANTQVTGTTGSANWKLNFNSKAGKANVSVSETQRPGFEFQAGSCLVTHLDGTTSSTTITGEAATQLTGVVPGDQVVCTYTNRPIRATVKVDKVWKINGQTVANGSQPDGMSATLQLTPPGQSGTPLWGDVRTGFVINQEVNINETTAFDPAKVPGCRLTGSTIEGSGITGTATLGANGHRVNLPGATNTYTVTNSVQCQTLTIVKQVNNNFGGNLGPADWNGKLTATGTAGTLTFNHNQTKYVESGTYLLSESNVPGYIQDQLTCTGGTLNGATVTVPAGGNAVCTFINRDLPGAVEITKQDRTDQALLAGATFELWRDANSNGVIDSGDTQVGAGKTTPASGMVDWTGLAWGSYVVKETAAPTGYELSSPNTRSFTVNGTNTATQRFTFQNPRKPGSVAWAKTDATDQSALGGSAWTLTGPGVPTGTVVTDCVDTPCATTAYADQNPAVGGFQLAGLPWGSYTLKETTTPDGYEGSATFTFTVSANNAGTVIAGGNHTNVRKTGSVIWTKVDSDNNDAPLPGSTWTVTGPGATDGVKITDCTAGPCGTGPFDDRDPAPGKFRVDGLIWGDYTFEETGVPEGYEGNASFDVTINAAAVHNGVVNMGNQPNKRMTGAVAWSKTDADGNLLGGSVWTLKGTGLAADPVVVDCTAATCPEGPYLDQDPAAGKFLLMGLPWASYTLTETKPPLGYTGGAEFTFTVDATSVQDLVNGGEHKNVRKTGSVIWNKVDELSKPLGGSQWRIIGPGHPAPGTVFADCTAAGCTGLDRNPAPGEFELVGLEWGSYTISEAAPPVGHTGTHTFHVEITAANAGQVLGNGSFVNKRKLGAVEWSKVDDLDKSLLGGSEWTLTGPGAAGGIVVVDCTEPTCATGPFTDQDPDAGEFRVEGLVWGAYTAVETGNPQGFTGSRDFAFVVDAEKSEATQEFGPFDNTRIPGAVAWNKVDADGGALLGGSEWIITGGDITPTVIVDCVESPCATDPLTDQDPAVGQFALAGLPWGTYTVTESKSPEGYTGVAEFSFTVAADTVEGGERTFGPFTNSKQAGGISWQKVDSEDGNHLAGSAWTVTGPGIDGIVVADCVEATCPADPFTDQNANPGEFLLEGLPWGTYTITETTVPTGYEGDASFTVTIDASNAGTVIGMGEQENKRKPGLVTWTKVDAENDTLLAGSVWKITGPGAPDGETVIDCVAAGCATGEFTDVDPVAGQFKLEGLAWGTYTVEETVTPEGYTDKKSFTFEVTAENAGTAIVIEAQKNERKPGAVIWRKTDAVDGALLAGSTWTLTGPGVPADTVVVDCVEADCLEGDFLDQDATPGGFKLDGLAWGDYTLREKAAPDGYVISSEAIEFTIGATTVAAEIDLGDVDNDRIPGTAIWTKVAKGSGDLLAGSEWSLTGPGHPSGTAVTDCIGDCAGLLDQDPTAGGFKLTDLDWGSYTLIETKAPPGYRLDATPHQFVIGVDGEASLEIDLQQIENVQRTGPVLPLTGGIGRDQIVLAGAFVLLLALLAFAGRRLRNPRSA